MKKIQDKTITWEEGW